MNNYTFEYQFLPRVVRHYHRGFNISQLFAEPLTMLKNVFLNIYAAHDDQVYAWEELLSSINKVMTTNSSSSPSPPLYRNRRHTMVSS